MIVQMTHEEVVEACKEWIERHHGLAVQGDARTFGRYTRHSLSSVEPCDQLSVQFPDVQRAQHPYRDPTGN